MSPRWGFRILGCPVLYKHAAPLGLNAPMNLFHLPAFLSSAVDLCGVPFFTYHASTCRPAGALGYLVVPYLYKHAAPLGLNAPMNLFHLPAFLSSAVDLCGVPFFTYHASTCRPAGALGYLVVPYLYKHAAPLGLNASLSPLPPFSLSCFSAVFLLLCRESITHHLGDNIFVTDVKNILTIVIYIIII